MMNNGSGRENLTRVARLPAKGFASPLLVGGDATSDSSNKGRACGRKIDFQGIFSGFCAFPQRVLRVSVLYL